MHKYSGTLYPVFYSTNNTRADKCTCRNNNDQHTFATLLQTSKERPMAGVISDLAGWWQRLNTGCIYKAVKIRIISVWQYSGHRKMPQNFQSRSLSHHTHLSLKKFHLK